MKNKLAKKNPNLSKRELQVLTLVSEGYCNREIANKLSITHHTVKFHIREIYEKMDVFNRARAVYLGIQRGLIKFDNVPAPAVC